MFTPWANLWLFEKTSNKQNKNTIITKTTKRNPKNLGGGENLIARLTTLLDLKFQCSTKTTKSTERIEKYGPFKGKTIQQNRPLT